MQTNVITAFFNRFNFALTAPLWQYDYGQILQFSGIELPETYEVHFGTTGETVTVLGDENGVEIPDSLLLTGEDINAYIYLHTGTSSGETVYSIRIPVKRRPMPSEDTPTPVQQDLITQAIAALNDAVERAESAAASLVVDDSLSSESENPVQNKVITDALSSAHFTSIDFAATLTDWDTMGNATTDVPFDEIIQKIQSGAVSARLALTVGIETYNVNLQGFSAGNAASFYGVGQLQEELRVIALLGAEGYWFAATETLGGGGTSDYDQLSNRPQINGNTLIGNKTAAQLGLGTYSKPISGIPASDLASGVIPPVPSASNAIPINLGTASSGASNDYSRADHVHESELFKAVYGTTTSSQIESAHQAGKQIVVVYNNRVYQLVHRSSSTSHHFEAIDPVGGASLYWVQCNNNAWTNGVISLAIPEGADEIEWTGGNLGQQEPPETVEQAVGVVYDQIPSSAADVGAIAAPVNPSIGDFLVYSSSGWTAQTLAVWQGGSY